MYTRRQASQLRHSFWTAFGKYMLPVPDADGNKINWINYKTGVKHIFFRMEVTNTTATVAIEITHADEAVQRQCFQQFLALQKMFEEIAGEGWEWEEKMIDERGKSIARISKMMRGVNVFSNNSWPMIISFLKPQLIALDAFWSVTRGIFE